MRVINSKSFFILSRITAIVDEVVLVAIERLCVSGTAICMTGWAIDHIYGSRETTAGMVAA
jgi:hypothetical protein